MRTYRRAVGQVRFRVIILDMFFRGLTVAKQPRGGAGERFGAASTQKWWMLQVLRCVCVSVWVLQRAFMLSLVMKFSRRTL